MLHAEFSNLLDKEGASGITQVMVDPGIGQAIVKWLNRWFRKRAKPRGAIDHYYRGIRMTRTAANRVLLVCLWLFLLGFVVGFFFMPDIFSGHPTFIKALLMAGWLLMAIFLLLGPLAAARDFAIVTDDALIVPKLFGGETRMAWNDITSIRAKLDSNEVTFITGDKRKCKISLAYDGWRDLLDTASKRMKPSVYYQLLVLRQNVDANASARPTKKSV